LGLGHAILCAKPFVRDEPFVVILSDDLLNQDSTTLKDMIEIYEEKKAPVIAVEKVPMENVQRYGIIDGKLKDGVYEITDLVEKPKPEDAPSNQGIIGRYILTPEIFDILEKQKPGAGGEIQLTDALRTFVRKRPIYGYPIKERRYDAGDKLGYLEATVDFALANKALAPGFRKFLLERMRIG
jgi:UTP--glucose-1-phosphate uridylyltransferase